MLLSEAKKISLNVLKEYSSDDSLFTSFSGKGLTKGSGKKADNIAAGVTDPYKDDTYITAYEKKLPNLGKITQKLKKEKPEYTIEVVGPALEELMVLFRTFDSFKIDDNGDFKLPFGDNIRLRKIGKNYFIKYTKPKPKSKQEKLLNDLTQLKN